MSRTGAVRWMQALDIDEQALDQAFRAALASDGEGNWAVAAAGQEGLTEAEITLLRAGGADPDAPPQGASDPLAESIAAHTQLLAQGLTTQAAAKRLGVTDARVRQRIDAGTLLAMRYGRGWRLPSFQFTADGEVPGWGVVCRELPTDASPVALAQWFALPQDDLVVGDDETPVSPRQWLLEGRPPGPVAALAAGLR